MSIWDEIFNEINLHDLIFMSIGCSMDCEDYNEITEENNQQYPCFLNNFNGSKLIILIDPMLEQKLKIEKYFIQIGKPLVCINTTFEGVRIFKNKTVTIYALNEAINYIYYLWINKEKAPDTLKIYNIVNLCLNNLKNTKFILQDFSGGITTTFYSELLKEFDRDDVLNHINLDVTQNDGGCRFKITRDLVKLNEHGNFIQEKFIELSKIKNSVLFNTIINFRINTLVYPIAFYYSMLLEDSNYELDIHNIYIIKLIASIYNVEYDEKIKVSSYNISKFFKLFEIILKDIIVARELEESLYDYIISIINDRKLLYETIKILKFE
jgi:hypothetical protein